MLEVEIKAKVTGFSEIKEKLKTLNAKFEKTETQKDIYFAHPARDFSETDEAFRVRQINDEFFLTYKGPKVDVETKTREEIEIAVEKNIIKILKKLGFLEWRKVKKTREIHKLGDLTVCLDDVPGLGKFIEIETHDYENKDKINLIQNIEGFPQKAKIDNFKLLKDIQTVLQKCNHLSEQQRLMYCQSQRYFMKLYLREINKRM